MSHHRLIIIGSGPAGLTAGLYAARAALQPLIFEGFSGSQLDLTTDVENWPGEPDGIMGPEIIERLRDQAEKFGATTLMDEVVRADLTATPKAIEDASGNTYTADAIIIATGAKARMLDIPGEDQFIGAGLSTCAVCDAAFFKGKDVKIVGGGDSAAEEAIFLTKFADKVTMIHRSDRYRASKIMLERVRNHPKIEMREFLQPVRLDGEQHLSTVIVQDTRTGEELALEADGLFLAIGHIPQVALFEGQLKLTEQGYIRTDGGGEVKTATSVPGVFACGDVADHRYRQAATSAGSGCMAAIDAEHYLSHTD